MSIETEQIVTDYAKMWPRELFDFRKSEMFLQNSFEALRHPGVYVLYRDDIPYYIGKTKKDPKPLIWTKS
jgi:hypothetical protein